MSFDGNGVFLRVMNWTQDAANGIKILANRHDAEDDNLANGLTNCLTKDGQSTPTADIKMGGKKLINLGAGTAGTDAATVSQVQTGTLSYFTDTGTANTYLISPTPPITSYSAGQSFTVKIANANTGASTLAVSALPALPVVTREGAALASGALPAGGIFTFTNNVTNWQVNVVSGVGALTALQVSGLTTLGDVKIVDSINDTNNNEVIGIGSVASAVNEVTITNAITATNPVIAATGGDTNIGLDLSAKGTGVINLKGTATAPAELRFSEQTTNGTNFVGLKAPAAITTDVTYTLPVNTPTNGQFMQWTTGNLLQWATPPVVPAINLGTPVTMAGATSYSFTGIPSTAKRVTVILSGFGTSGTSRPIIQLGTGGVAETTGYSGASSRAVASAIGTSAWGGTGTELGDVTWANTYRWSGKITIDLIDSAANAWVISSVGGDTSTARTWLGGGSKTLAGVLDSIFIKATNGTDTLNNGTVNVSYE